MSTYLSSSRIDDVGSRNLGNRSIADYILHVDVPRRSHIDLEFMTQNSLHVRDGYGYCDATAIDTDSTLRLDSSVTNTRSRKPLLLKAPEPLPRQRDQGDARVLQQDIHYARIFDSAEKRDERPDPTRIPFEQRSNRSSKGQAAEADFTQFTMTPLLPVMHNYISNDVPGDNFIAIGQPSRDLLKRQQHVHSSVNSRPS
jgi:hypothetical protein